MNNVKTYYINYVNINERSLLYQVYNIVTENSGKLGNIVFLCTVLCTWYISDPRGRSGHTNRVLYRVHWRNELTSSIAAAKSLKESSNVIIRTQVIVFK